MWDAFTRLDFLFCLNEEASYTFLLLFLFFYDRETLLFGLTTLVLFIWWASSSYF